MMQSTSALGAQIPASEYAARRSAVLDYVKGDGAIVVVGSPAPARSFERFSQNADFNYLTGLQEPAAFLLLVKRAGARKEMLFVDRRTPSVEVWQGARPGPEGASKATGVTARDAGQLDEVVDSLIALGLPVQVVEALGDRSRWKSELEARHPKAIVQWA